MLDPSSLITTDSLSRFAYIFPTCGLFCYKHVLASFQARLLKEPLVLSSQHVTRSRAVRYSEGGLWARFKYVCCKEAGQAARLDFLCVCLPPFSGAPVAMVSRGPDHARVNRPAPRIGGGGGAASNLK